MFESEDVKNMALTLLIIGVFRKFFHRYKAELMASHYGWRLQTRPLTFYAAFGRRAGVISATLG